MRMKTMKWQRNKQYGVMKENRRNVSGNKHVRNIEIIKQREENGERNGDNGRNEEKKKRNNA